MRRNVRSNSRRHFVRYLAASAAVAGVLRPLWDTLAATGDIAKVYPDELLSIEEYTRGQISSGDLISADNVELVRELLTPSTYQQVAHMGRRLLVGSTTTDIMRLSPWEYLEATFRNRGLARFDARGNVVSTPDGQPWIGGIPFPDSPSALELFAGLTLSWGRHDASFYAIKEYEIAPDGRVQFQYDAGWAEVAPVARVSMDPRPYWPGHQDKLRYQSIVFTAPQSVNGTSFLNVWPYDQNMFPELWGYLPEFKRIRQFPTSQRFESLIPGSTLYLSDAWAAGDPLHTWGNYRIVGRTPLLAAVTGGWNAEHANWEHRTHGGPKGKTFWDTVVELVPEAIVVEAEPVRFPRAPVSKKRVWFDARTQLPIGMVSYDRRGEPFRSFDGAFGLYEADGGNVRDGAHPYWSWCHVHAFDLQTQRMTRLEQVRMVSPDHVMRVNDPAIYERYLTQSAMVRLGGGS